VRLVRYQPEMASQWDAFVRASRNGTFLLERRYMDYHADRFPDQSWVVANAADEWIAAFPATIRGDALVSHAGLTYGGFVSAPKMTTPTMLACFELLISAADDLGCGRLVYKTIPHIYHRLPAEDDVYALFRFGAVVHRRDVLSVVRGGARGPVQERRARGAKKAAKSGVVVTRSADFAGYWQVLDATLRDRHDARPVHTADEIATLAVRCPDEIQLWVATRGADLLAGVVMYVSDRVAHAQYIAATPAGRDAGALDLLFETLISQTFAHAPWFDFGISNEDDGRVLNAGLIEQKEGFGARAVVHDHYTLTIARTAEQGAR
jgi:hypothetical protein